MTSYVNDPLLGTSDSELDQSLEVERCSDLQGDELRIQCQALEVHTVDFTTDSDIPDQQINVGKRPTMKSVSVQTEPLKCDDCRKKLNLQEKLSEESTTVADTELLCDDLAVNSERSDPSYIPENLSGSIQAAATTDKTFTSTKRKINKVSTISSVIVDLDALLGLFVYCVQCGARVLATKVRYLGASVVIDYRCCYGHSATWRSGKIFNRSTFLNIRISSAASMSGLGYSTLESFCRLLEIPLMSKPVFYSLTRKWLYPVIAKDFTTMRDKTIGELQSVTDGLVVCGDAQFDSPGYSAKYCTYTLMQCGTDKVVDFVAIQKGQYEGELEKQACEELLAKIVKEDKLKIKDFVTDAHAGIGKLMREEYPAVHHAHDIWHFGKSLRKKLVKVSKKHPKISAWENSVVNHFWWSAKNCKGDPDLLLELFHSLLSHVLNIHNWGRRKKIHQDFRNLQEKRPYPKPPSVGIPDQKCLHGRLTKGNERKCLWFKLGEPDYEALFKVLTNTKLCNSMKKCAKFLHTGALEALHCAKLKYLPKRKAFKMDTTIVMMMLVCLEPNNRLTAVTKTKTRIAYSRAQKKYVLKNTKTMDNLSLKKAIMSSVRNNVKDRRMLALDLSRYKRKSVPRTFHKPSRETLEKEKLTRLNRK